MNNGNKFLLTFDNKRIIYSYTQSNEDFIYTILSEKETTGVLQRLADSKIKNIVNKSENAIEITYESGLTIVLDDTRIFKYKSETIDDIFIKNLYLKIMKFAERRNVIEYKKTLPEGYKPRVNRKKKKNIAPKLIVSGLSALMIFYLSTSFNKEIKKENIESKPNELEFNLVIEESNNDIINNINIGPKKDIILYEEIKSPIEEEKDNTICVSLEFGDRTQTGKLQSTEAFCGGVLKYYCERYGLPYEVMLAQITQESPNVVNGKCQNPCQITYELFIGRKMYVPVYDVNGFTGEYDIFTVTKEMLKTTEGNIMAGMAYNRYCIDKYNSLFTGMFSYNQGENALKNACEYYGLNVDDYKGDEKSIEARDLINKYYQDLGLMHGDAKYLEHVFSYLPLDERGIETIEYYLGNELITLDLNNANVYNSELSR